PRLLFLYGPPAVGKTHILRSALTALRTREPAARLVRRTGIALKEELITAAQSEALATLYDAWLQIDAAAVDDLHVLAGMPATQREVAELFGVALRGGAQMICAAGCPLSDLSVLAAALRGLRSARLIELGPPSDGEMQRILDATARRHGMQLEAATLADIAVWS